VAATAEVSLNITVSMVLSSSDLVESYHDDQPIMTVMHQQQQPSMLYRNYDTKSSCKLVNSITQ